jgi:hypothetical protein
MAGWCAALPWRALISPGKLPAVILRDFFGLFI